MDDRPASTAAWELKRNSGGEVGTAFVPVLLYNRVLTPAEHSTITIVNALAA